ncbi:hypothetical protein BJY52DRAFT_1396719 [Lactarius psammicola]|nr:hypothetical protein BJY52DRAFT_1396719 [Lactarius psammicola]
MSNVERESTSENTRSTRGAKHESRSAEGEDMNDETEMAKKMMERMVEDACWWTSEGCYPNTGKVWVIEGRPTRAEETGIRREAKNDEIENKMELRAALPLQRTSRFACPHNTYTGEGWCAPVAEWHPVRALPLHEPEGRGGASPGVWVRSPGSLALWRIHGGGGAASASPWPPVRRPPICVPLSPDGGGAQKGGGGGLVCMSPLHADQGRGALRRFWDCARGLPLTCCQRGGEPLPILAIPSQSPPLFHATPLCECGGQGRGGGGMWGSQGEGGAHEAQAVWQWGRGVLEGGRERHVGKRVPPPLHAANKARARGGGGMRLGEGGAKEEAGGGGTRGGQGRGGKEEAGGKGAPTGGRRAQGGDARQRGGVACEPRLRPHVCEPCLHAKGRGRGVGMEGVETGGGRGREQGRGNSHASTRYTVK